MHVILLHVPSHSQDGTTQVPEPLRKFNYDKRAKNFCYHYC